MNLSFHLKLKAGRKQAKTAVWGWVCWSVCTVCVQRMNNVWVAALIDVGYRVSSQPAEGLFACVQTPTQCTADFKGCGLDSLMYKHKLKPPPTPTHPQRLPAQHTNTNTHTHILSLSLTHENSIIFAFLHTVNTTRTTANTRFPHRCARTHTHTGIRWTSYAPKTGTHRVLCAEWWVWDLGGGRPGFPHLYLQQ